MRLRKYRMILVGDEQSIYDLYADENNEKYVVLSVYASTYDVIFEYYPLPYNEEESVEVLQPNFNEDCIDGEINEEPMLLSDFLEELYTSNWCVESIEYVTM